MERSSISLISLLHTALVLSCRFVFLLPTALTQRPAVVDTILHYQRACSLICKSDISTLLTLTSFHLNQLCWFSKARAKDIKNLPKPPSIVYHSASTTLLLPSRCQSHSKNLPERTHSSQLSLPNTERRRPQISLPPWAADHLASPLEPPITSSSSTLRPLPPFHITTSHAGSHVRPLHELRVSLHFPAPLSGLRARLPVPRESVSGLKTVHLLAGAPDRRNRNPGEPHPPTFRARHDAQQPGDCEVPVHDSEAAGLEECMYLIPRSYRGISCDNESCMHYYSGNFTNATTDRLVPRLHGTRHHQRPRRTHALQPLQTANGRERARPPRSSQSQQQRQARVEEEARACQDGGEDRG